LLEMLEHLRIYPGRGSLEELRHNCGIYMEAVGLRGDVAAASLGSNEIRQLIISGCSALEAEEMRQLVDRLGLRAASPRATLLIQAIDRYPWLETAVASVDWVDDFRGSEPRERRVALDPSFWNAKFKPELEGAVAKIRRQGFTDIRVEGAFRLSTGFAAGAALPRAAGLTVAFRDWPSTAEPDEFPVRATTHDVDQGNELAVAICVTGDIAEDVVDYLQRESLPVEKLVTIAPAGGAGQRSIPGEAEVDPRRSGSARFHLRRVRRDPQGSAWAAEAAHPPKLSHRRPARTPLEPGPGDSTLRRCKQPRRLFPDLPARELARVGPPYLVHAGDYASRSERKSTDLQGSCKAL
jgi:SMODS-associated and fused to various effectors sensor domain